MTNEFLASASSAVATLVPQALHAFVFAAVVPCALLVGIGSLARHFARPRTAGTTRRLGFRQLLVRGFACGLGIGIFTLLPIPFTVTVIIASGLCIFAASVLAWRGTFPVASVFVAVAGMMLGTVTVEILTNIVYDLEFGTNATANWSASLTIMWILYAIPSSIIALLFAGLAAQTRRPQSADAPARVHAHTR